MAVKTAAIIQSGTSNYLTPAESFNVVATDTLTPGIVGSYTSTSGVAPTTGSFAVNAQGSPNMTVAVSAGQAYVNATPTSGTAQNIRVKLASSENVTIAANSTGGTRYDFVYIKVDADKLNNPAADGTDVVTLTTQRSTTSTVDSNGALANALCIAIVTVTNGAVAINNADISDYRIACSSTFDGWSSANESHVYASATTVTVPSGALSKYSPGDKYRIYQNNTVKYFYIIGVTNTLLTITGGSDYTLTNSTISNPFYSKRATPLGFPQYFNYSPTWYNLTVGSGTVIAKFNLTGGMVHYWGSFVYGAGSAVGTSASVSLPILLNASAWYPSENFEYGHAHFQDTGSAAFTGTCRFDANDRLVFAALASGGTYASHGTTASTIPFTWGTSDKIQWNTVYPAV